MNHLRKLIATALLTTCALNTNASIVDLSAFDGSESVIDFNSEATGSFSGSFSTQGVTFQPESDSYMFQSGGGYLIGSIGTALNTVGSSSGFNDLTLLFSSSISKFGMRFGTGAGAGPLSAVVSAYDNNGIFIESTTLASFENAFIGFDFSSSASKIVIDRTDSTGYFTFIDDVRFVKSVETPEPSSLGIFGAAVLALALVRRRKKSNLSPRNIYS